MKYSNLKAFEKHLTGSKPNHFAQTYLILCKEAFERKTAVDALIAAFFQEKKEAELGVKHFEPEHAELNDILRELNARSFFSERKLVIVHQTDKPLKALLDGLLAYLSHPNKDTYLILAAPSINHATNFYKQAEKIGVVLEVAEEKPWEKEKTMVEWVQVKVASEGKRINPQACQLLVKQTGTDHALISSELEKLFCYIGSRNEITLQDVGAVCISVNYENIWQLGEALFRREAGTALRISKALIADGSQMLALLRQMRSQFQTEYQVCSILAKGGHAGDVTQQFPYMRGQILERHMQMAREYGMERLNKGLLTIDETELKAKNGNIDPDLLLEMLCIKLTT